MATTTSNATITARLDLNRIDTFLQVNLLRNFTETYAGKTA